MKVSDILRVKGTALFTTPPHAPLWQAVQTMAENDIGSIVVMDHGRLAGMLTFREVLKTVHANGGWIGDGAVRQVMDAQPLIVGSDTDVNLLRPLMLEKHTRYVPVMDGGTLMGVISFYDVARAVLEEQGFENKMLKAYIRDWPEPESPAA
ncbi:MAG: CBS domain-containing protein [Betaproteobacteria bacterium]